MTRKTKRREITEDQIKTHTFTIKKKTSTTGLIRSLKEYPTVRASIRRNKLVALELVAGGLGIMFVTDKEHASQLKLGDIVLVKTVGDIFSRPIAYTDAQHQIIPYYTLTVEYRQDLKL